MGCRGLLFRHGAYYARLVIPAELRPALDGKTELRERLGTDKRQSERDVHAAMARFHDRVAEARRSLIKSLKPSIARPLTTPEIARTHYAEELAFDDWDRLAEAKGYQGAPAEWREPYRDLLRKVASRRASDDEIGAAIGWSIHSFTARGATKAEPGTDAWRQLGHALAAVHLDAVEREAERDRGDFDGTPRLAILGPAKAAPSAVPADTSRVLGPES